jgi:hypothetical protein
LAHVNCFSWVFRARAAQPGNCLIFILPCLATMSDSTDMDTFINLQRLQYADLLKLGKLAAEAMALSQEYDQSRSRTYCKLVAACNVEMLARRRKAERHCGTTL